MAPENPVLQDDHANRIPNAAEVLKALAALEAEFRAVLDPTWSAPSPPQAIDAGRLCRKA